MITNILLTIIAGILCGMWHEMSKKEQKTKVSKPQPAKIVDFKEEIQL